MTKYAFTICSNNYLPKAKVLQDSLLKFNPEYKFVIALCDKKSKKIDYSIFSNTEIIEVHNLEIENFDDMKEKYNIVEFNTSIKPFVFKYIFKHFDAESAIYFDPDICIYDSISCIEDEMQNCSILLTPHIYYPIEPDGKYPDENTFTQYGLYNLGFIAAKNNDNAKNLISWWARRMAVNCFIKPKQGIFVDQLPMNFTPIFFDSVKISKNQGLNVAPWNYHEREITRKEGKYFVNDEFPLIFLHISNYNPNTPEQVSKCYNRVSFEGRLALKNLYKKYAENILKNGFNDFAKITCFYNSELSNWESKPVIKESLAQKISKYIKKYPFFLFRKDFYELLKNNYEK